MFQLGREGVVELNGNTYVLSRLERRIVERFRDWIKEREGDPFAEVKDLLPHLDPAEAKEMIAEAKAVKQQLQCFSLACPLAQKYLHTELGQAELLYLLLVEKQPQITREQAFRLWNELGAQAVAEKIQQAQGSPPPEKNAAPPEA